MNTKLTLSQNSPSFCMRTCQYCVGQYQYRNIVLKVFTKQFFGVISVSIVLVKNIKTNKKGVDIGSNLKFCNTNIREVVLNTTYTQQGHNLHFDMCSVASNICSMQCTLCTFVPTRALQPKLACRHSPPLLLVHFGHRRELDLPTWACSRLLPLWQHHTIDYVAFK